MSFFLRQPPEMRLLQQELFQRPDGCPPQDLAAPNVLAVQDTTLPAYNRAVIEACMFSDSDLAADYALRAECGTAGDSGLSSNYRVFANFDVVRDLNQIVELHTAPNDRRFQ